VGSVKEPSRRYSAVSDLAEQQGMPDEPNANGRSEPEAIFEYVDEGGAPLYQVLRYPGKRFVQRRPKPGGGWIWNLDDTQRVLFHLDGVLSHLGANDQGPIYIAEGEKDVLAIEAAGATATCNSQGAGKWDDAFSEALRGARRVVVVADRDEPGERHARQVCESLAAVGVVAEVVQALEGKDASDHLDAGYTLEELEPVEVVEQETAHTLDLLDLSELLARPPTPPRWIWAGRIAEGDVALVVGDPGVGKSLLALALGLTLAGGGGEVLDEICNEGEVLMVDLENTIDVVRERVDALALQRATLGALGYVHRPPGFNLGDAAWLGALRATVLRMRPRLVVIDSVRRAAPGLEENDSNRVAAFMAPIRDLAAESGSAILLVHHPRKSPAGGEKVDALHAARGSGDLVASCDVLLYVRRLSGGLLRLEHGKARRGHEHEPVHFRIVEAEGGGPALELVQIQHVDEGDLDDRVLEYVTAHPGDSTKAVEDGVEGSRLSIRNALERRATSGYIAAGPGRHPRGKYWYPANHAELVSPGDMLAIAGELSPHGSEGDGVARVADSLKEAAPGDTFDPVEELDWR
jgi:5S rRNA maturation endonuclease (ribonuclease M5)